MCPNPCHYTTPKVSPNVNRQLWATMTFQCRFIHSNKCTTLLEDGVMGEAVRVWGRSIWDISVPYSQFCYEPKPAQKKKKNNRL